jgi:S-formylglutathione hydrolase FrmB
MRRAGNYHVRPAAPKEPRVLLTPRGNSAVQTIPDFVGPVTGHLHRGHLLWLPPNEVNAPVIYMMSGQGATPTTTVTNTLTRFQTAITAGHLPRCGIVFPNTRDPDDSIEGWGMDSADGSYPLETMLRLDLPAYLAKYTRLAKGPKQRAMVGFSKGGFETLRMRAKWGASAFAVYVVVDSPRLDADLGGAAQTYGSFTAAEKLKLFGNNDAAPSVGSAKLQAESPCSTTAATGLFNVLGANAGGLGAAPLLMLESDPGGGSPATQAASMNNMINTRLPALSVTFTTANLDNATFTPNHNLAECFDAWNGEATNNMSWIRTNAGWVIQ